MNLANVPARLTPSGTTFDGRVKPGDLPRVAPELANPEGELHYRVTARLDSHQQRVLSCIIDGFVFLTCQSTLEVFRHPIATEDRLVLVGSEEELPPIEGESDEEDYVVATDPLDPLGLVEDAVLLAPRWSRESPKPGFRRGRRRPGRASLRRSRRSRASRRRDNRIHQENTMAVQQNKKAPSKRGMHRAHDFLVNPPTAVEPGTGETHLEFGSWYSHLTRK